MVPVFAEAHGMAPEEIEILRRMTIDKWLDQLSMAMQNSTWPIHDRILGLQSSVLTMVMNPTRLQRVYDNELMTPAKEDMITLPEVNPCLFSCTFGRRLCQLVRLHHVVGGQQYGGAVLLI
jgi:hypothetical protein